MKKIKFGLKLWSINTDLIEEAEEILKEENFNYIELTFIPGSDIKPFLDRKVEYILHLPTGRHGVNIGDFKKIEENLKIIREGLEWADKLNARYAILHPGYGELKDVETFLGNIDDDRILLENMPVYGLDYEDMVGSSKKELNQLMDEKFGFCFDLNHAVKAAISLNKNYKEYIKDLLKLNPKMFHVADGKLDYERDEHLDIGEGEYDWNFLLDIIKRCNSKYVTLETPRENLEDDIKNLKKIMEEWP